MNGPIDWKRARPTWVLVLLAVLALSLVGGGAATHAQEPDAQASRLRARLRVHRLKAGREWGRILG